MVPGVTAALALGVGALAVCVVPWLYCKSDEDSESDRPGATSLDGNSSTCPSFRASCLRRLNFVKLPKACVTRSTFKISRSGESITRNSSATEYYREKSVFKRSIQTSKDPKGSKRLRFSDYPEVREYREKPPRAGIINSNLLNRSWVYSGQNDRRSARSRRPRSDNLEIADPRPIISGPLNLSPIVEERRVLDRLHDEALPESFSLWENPTSPETENCYRFSEETRNEELEFEELEESSNHSDSALNSDSKSHFRPERMISTPRKVETSHEVQKNELPLSVTTKMIDFVETIGESSMTVESSEMSSRKKNARKNLNDRCTVCKNFKREEQKMSRRSRYQASIPNGIRDFWHSAKREKMGKSCGIQESSFDSFKQFSKSSKILSAHSTIINVETKGSNIFRNNLSQRYEDPRSGNAFNANSSRKQKIITCYDDDPLDLTIRKTENDFLDFCNNQENVSLESSSETDKKIFDNVNFLKEKMVSRKEKFSSFKEEKKLIRPKNRDQNENNFSRKLKEIFNFHGNMNCMRRPKKNRLPKDSRKSKSNASHLEMGFIINENYIGPCTEL